MSDQSSGQNAICFLVEVFHKTEFWPLDGAGDHRNVLQKICKKLCRQHECLWHLSNKSFINGPLKLLVMRGHINILCISINAYKIWQTPILISSNMSFRLTPKRKEITHLVQKHPFGFLMAELPCVWFVLVNLHWPTEDITAEHVARFVNTGF